MVAFLFGGDTAESPESLKRKRKVAEALAASNGAPKSLGEGLSAVGNALLYRSLMSKVDAGEEVGRKTADADWGSLFGSSEAPAAGPAGASGSMMPKVGADGSIPVTSSSPAVASTPTSFDGNQQEFIASITPAAIDEGKRTGVDPRIIISQAALESGYGKHAPGNNYFGIKSHGEEGGNSLMTSEVVDGKAVRQRDSFRAYDNPTDSVRGYGDFITQNPRYGKFRSAQGLDNQIAELQASGYATDPNYGSKIRSIANGIQLPQEVASLDPSAGMSPAADAIERQAPADGFRDPSVSAPNYSPSPSSAAPSVANGPSPVATALVRPQAGQQAGLPPLPSRDIGPTPNVAGVPPEATPPSVQVAQALARTPQPGSEYYPAAPNPPGQAGPSMQQISKVLNNAYSTEAQRGVAEALLKRKLDEQNPDTALNREYKRAQLDALKAKPEKQWQRLDDETLFNPATGDTRKATGAGVAGATPGFRFRSKTVEADALNGLMDSGDLTAEQAQQLAAGKQITNPADGSVIFMTPQGIFGKPANGGLAQPLGKPPASDGVDIFAGSPLEAARQAAPTTLSTATSADSPSSPTISPRPGMIQLTEPKPGKPLTEGERKNQSLYYVMKPELKVVEDHFNALSDPKNQALSKLPLSEFVTTPEYQKAANSLQTIITSYLYSVSGATATPEEVKKQTDSLTPRPGESKASIDNKRKRVRTMVNAVAKTGGLPEEPDLLVPPGDPAKPMTDEDFNALPSGAKYIDPDDGKTYSKP